MVDIAQEIGNYRLLISFSLHCVRAILTACFLFVCFFVERELVGE